MTEVHGCKDSLALGQSVLEKKEVALFDCNELLGEETPSLGVLGAAVAFLMLVDLARLLWMRHHGTAGPLFPWDM